MSWLYKLNAGDKIEVDWGILEEIKHVDSCTTNLISLTRSG